MRAASPASQVGVGLEYGQAQPVPFDGLWRLG
jgi:hypothetical protein